MLTHRVVYFWAVLVTLCVVGCAPGRLEPLANDFSPGANADEGYILASVTSNGGRSAKFYIRHVLDGVVRPLESRGTGLFELASDFADEQDSGRNSSQRGRLMLVAVPAGQYELINWALLLIRREHDRKRLTPAQLPAIPFSVRAGEVVYLGNLHVAVTYGGDPGSVPGPLAPIVTARARVTDRSARDVALMAERYPNFLHSPLRLSVKSRPEWDLTIQR